MKVALLFWACVLAAPVASAQEDSAAASRGLFYAERLCADCHGVTADQKQSPNPAAPTFVAIANTPGMTPMALNVWLHTSHPTMPNLIVDQARISDLAAYVRTLKKSSSE
jgi:mono/diheme cytochrome c family protein